MLVAALATVDVLPKNENNTTRTRNTERSRFFKTHHPFKILIAGSREAVFHTDRTAHRKDNRIVPLHRVNANEICAKHTKLCEEKERIQAICTAAWITPTGCYMIDLLLKNDMSEVY